MIKEEKLFSSLFGKSIKDIRVNKDNSIVAFVINDEETHYYYAEADCCSESWFENFVNSRYVICKTPRDRVISGAMFAICNCDIPASKQDVDIIHHVVLTVDNYKWKTNVTVFNLRNSSNGYYDGSIAYLGTSLENVDWAIGEPGQKVFRSVVME